ncbi:MAG: BlaI/MecI/CopY family transcriptional regulator [Clostridiales bacterium]
MESIPKLPESELEIMSIIWKNPKNVICDHVIADLNNDKNWSKTTVLSFLSRLVDRGFLAVTKKGRINHYSPIIKEEDYLEKEGKSFINKMYHDSVTDFVATLYNSNNISQDDLHNLKKLIKKME